MGIEDYNDITDVLKAVHEIDRVQPPIPEVLNEEATTLVVASTQRPSTSTDPAGHGSRLPVATPQVVPTPDPDPSPSTPHPSLSSSIPSPSPHPCLGFDIPPPTPQSFPELSPIPSFDLGIDPTLPNMQQEPPSHSTSIGPSSVIDPPHVQVEQVVRLLAVAEGRPKRISKAPPCGTGGHKHGHKPGPEASNEGHARPPPRYTR